MYKSFRIRNFRCFEDMKIHEFAQINLIAGMNNTGKTALLEALWIHHGRHNPELPIRLSTWRGVSLMKKKELMSDIFYNFDREKIIKLDGETWDDQISSLSIKLVKNPISRLPIDTESRIELNGSEKLVDNGISQETSESVDEEILFEFNNESGEHLQAHMYVGEKSIYFKQTERPEPGLGIFLSALVSQPHSTAVERYGNLIVDGEHKEIIKILQIIIPRLKNIVTVSASGDPVLYADIGQKKLVPIQYMGDGVNRLLKIATAIPEAKEGVLLVDEIENGFHYTVLVKAWKAIIKLARFYSVQFFATTHSNECIAACHKALEDDKIYDFYLHRLDLVDKRIIPEVYDKESMTEALKANLDIR